MRFGRFAFLLSSCLLAACGGGGSGDGGAGGSIPVVLPGGQDEAELLHVTLDWGPISFPLFQQVRMPATANGFEGHTPHCTLLSGELPPGMTLDTDCALSGRATTPGSYFFEYRVGASGVRNTLDFRTTVSVFGPTIQYQVFFSPLVVAVNGPVSHFPRVDKWSPLPTDTASWNYRVRTGSLPPGVTLEPDTGVIQGRVASAGDFDVEIEAMLTTAFGSYVTPATRMRWEASVRSFEYALQNSGLFEIPVTSTLTKGEFYRATPRTEAHSFVGELHIVSGTLPPGLAFDAATGVVSGTPTSAGPAANVVIEGTVSTGMARDVVRVTLPLEVRAFAEVTYPGSATASVGAPLQLRPFVRNLVNLDAVTARLAPQSTACNLPAGVVLQPVTGVIEGTPTTAGTYDCTVDFELTHGVVTWLESAPLRLVVN